MSMYGAGGYGAPPQTQMQRPYMAGPPRVRFEAISEAWGFVRAQMGTWVVISLVYLLCYLAIVFGIEFLFMALGVIPNPFDRSGTPPTFDAKYILGNLAMNVVVMVASAFFYAGLIRTALKQVSGESIGVADLFGGGDALGGVVVTNILYGLAVYIGTLLCIVPGLYVAGRGALAMALAVDRKVGGVEALGQSWEALKNDAWNAVGLLIVVGFLSSLGVLACGVGALFTLPLAPLTLAIVYRDFFDTEHGPGQPTLNVPLPPQSAYGNPGYPQQQYPQQQYPQQPPYGGQQPPQNPPPPPGEMPRL